MLRFRLPERCNFCGLGGTVRPEHTIKGQAVEVMWCCNACSESWPITDEDYEPEERAVAPDRRKRIDSGRRNQGGT